MASILNIKNPETGNYEPILAIKGKSAYQAAKEAGYSGTEEKFNEGLAATSSHIINGTVVSENADNAEVGQWLDSNPNDEDRIGYFVAIDTATAGTTMVKATSTADVRGVTVSTPAFAGNCSADKFDSDGNLLKQYDYVAVMGLVSVIDNGTCTINGRCMPTDDGTAVPSTNNLGYQVIDRIDSTHILVAVEPGADMIQRIKNDMENKADLVGGKVPTTQLPDMDYAPSYTYGTTDLNAGTSTLETGKLYFVYE